MIEGMRSSIYQQRKKQQSSVSPSKNNYNNNNKNIQPPGDGYNVYPNATIQQYLNMKRVTKDKPCLILFLFYSLGIVILMGIGFFYGNYKQLGTFTNDAVTDRNNLVNCTNDKLYLDPTMTACEGFCASNYTYLGKICLPSATPNYNPQFSTQVQGLIQMYNIQYVFPMLTYVSASLTVFTTVLFVLLIFLPELVYFIIASLFVMLLAMSFYLLKNFQLRVQSYGLADYPSSVLYTEEQNTRSISFVLLGIYLVIFPFVLFSPKKIKLGVLILGKLRSFYKTMSNAVVFSILVVVVTWGMLVLEVFLVMNFYTAGNLSDTPQFSMFRTFQNINLSHPASLTFHFIGVFWINATLISWHKYFISSSMCIWYFQDSQGLQPVRRGLKRSLHHLGSAALDGILLPIEWIFLLIYSIVKRNTQSAEEEGEDDDQAQNCLTSCLNAFRNFLTTFYRSINRNSPSSAVLTNQNFLQSCRNSSKTFSQNYHRFFNIGGTLTIFLTLFTCVLWIIIFYFIVYYQVINKQFPPLITSVVLPIVCIFLIALVIGSLLTNIYTAAIDCLIFCYLTEKNSMGEGEVLAQEGLPGQNGELGVKKFLSQCYFKAQEQWRSDVFIYEQRDQNLYEITYIAKRE